MYNKDVMSQQSKALNKKSGISRTDLLFWLRPVVLFLAFFFLSLNMRAALTSLPPIIHDIRDMFGISTGLAGILTSIPVFCFGFLSPAAGLFIKKIGLESSIFVTLAGILAGILIRSAGSCFAMFAGTLLIGAAITIGNIAGLMVIGRDFSKNSGVMTGIYVSGMSLGAMATTALTSPLTQTAGWQKALAFPGIFAVIAIVFWVVTFLLGQNRQDKPEQKVKEKSASKDLNVIKQPIVWLLSIAFAAHTFLFYGFTAWLPLFLMQTNSMSEATAGWVASLFQILGLLGCFGLPILSATKRFSGKALFLMVTLSWVITAVGFWMAPSLWAVWIIFGGIGAGGGFTVIFSLIMDYATDVDENRGISTMVQSVGYMVASFSPFIVGHMHELTKGWSLSMAGLSLAGVVMTICGIFATNMAKGKKPVHAS